ncbi:hypothetical protein P7C71_g3689, partial [Lecanoromycetidae sp. Uapishka_2]
MHRNGSLSKPDLRSSFQELKDGAIVILHVAIQNSALILRKATNEYIIESFEASPPASKVLEAKAALQWDFPSRAVALPSSTFEDPFFQASLADFIERASVEPVKQFAATSLKAGAMAFESRDTASPAIIGQLLMALLEANGHKHNAKLTQKRVHDEVCWGDGAVNPWRRSAAWLVLKVGMQRSLCFLLGGHLGTLHYKFFSCFMLASVTKELSHQASSSADRIAFARTKLARRVAKLQQQKNLAIPQVTKAMNVLFREFGKTFSDTLEIANTNLAESWASVRAKVTKRIQQLPRRADPGSTVLSMVHSMILVLMELWQALDTIALGLYPILGSFDPGFPQDLLYPLQISELADMDRLQKIEQYLDRRRNRAESSISYVLGEPSRDCFSALYFDQCEEMQDLQSEIRAADESMKRSKEFQWIRESAEYEDTIKEAVGATCLFVEDELNPLRRWHDDRHCRKHYLERKAARMRIQVHEALLPADQAAAKAVVFELSIPPGFAAWRDATWQLLQLGRRPQVPDRLPHVFLYDYPGLKPYMEPTGSTITLASRTKFEESNPSANDVVASQTRCPNTLAATEYTAFQDLRLGSGVQWIRLLRELASSNLNLGTVEVGDDWRVSQQIGAKGKQPTA